VIELENVSLTYDGAADPALAGVDLRIADGEVVSLVGPSGSGKTTLVKLMNALLVPSEGRVLVDGLDTSNPEHLWDVRRRVGLIFQNPDNQIVSTTVERELAFGMENLGLAREEIGSRIESVLTELRLSDLRDRSPHRLSGGEKQRVAIGAVLAMRPSHLVLDEPTSLLDTEGRREVWRIIDELGRDPHRTVVHVTQFPNEIVLSQRVIVLAGGAIVFDGAPADLFARTDDLKHWGLARPAAMELAARLRNGGYRVPETVLTLAGLVDALTTDGGGGATC
jgi:energy-coupling factor transport system ATP-binding protein